MLEVKNLYVGYKKENEEKVLIKKLDFSFSLGDFIGIQGDNGVGKSSLLKTLYKTITPLSGEVILNDKNINAYRADELAKWISIVITDKVSGFNLTVKDVVSSGRIPYIDSFAQLSDKDEKIVEDSLIQMGIQHISKQLMEELSDGQRQKVMIAKSLAQECPIIVLDEPTAFLDHRSKQKLFVDLKKLAEEKQKLILISTHDIELMNQYVHKVLSIESTESYELIKRN
jgi:iron complex transport system ATP-binding protein